MTALEPGTGIWGNGGDQARLLTSLVAVYASTGSVLTRRFESGRGDEGIRVEL